jgi:hypothetical protein
VAPCSRIGQCVPCRREGRVVEDFIHVRLVRVIGLISSSFECENFIISVDQTCPSGKSKNFVYGMDTRCTGR